MTSTSPLALRLSSADVVQGVDPLACRSVRAQLCAARAERQLGLQGRRVGAAAWRAPNGGDVTAHGDGWQVTTRDDGDEQVVEVHADVDLGAVRLALRGAGPPDVAAVTPAAANVAAAAALARGLPVVGDDAGQAQQLLVRAQRTLVVEDDATDPALAHVVLGADVASHADVADAAAAWRPDGSLHVALPADQALDTAAAWQRDLAERLGNPADGGWGVVVSPLVTDAAEVRRAPASDRVGLLPFQRAAVGAHERTAYGLVLAAPPGSGKTVVTLAGWAVRVQHVPRWRALVVAPRATLEQWSAEASLHLPQVSTRVCASHRDLAAALDAAVSYPGAAAVLCSPALAHANLEDLTRRRWHDLCLDEADVLWRGGTRVASLRRLREASDRAVALTGTPDGGEPARRLTLLSWALGRPLSPDGGVSADVGGAYVQRTAFREHGEHLPSVRVDAVALHPTERARRRLEELAHEAASAPGERAAIARERLRHAAVDLRRVDGDADVRDAPKVGWVSRLLPDLAARGQRAAVFADRDPTIEDLREVCERYGHELVTPARARGVNLQHLDLAVLIDAPWTADAARQRVGRLRRVGASTPKSVLVPHLSGTTDETQVARLLEQLRRDV